MKPDFLLRVEALAAKRKLSLYHKIKGEKDMPNLKSLAAEAHYGFFFDEYCDQLDYDRKIFSGSEKTPDWCVTINGQTIIAEVCKLNPAKEDQERADAENLAIEEFKKNNPGIPVMGGYHRIMMKPEKLKGNNGSLAAKADKYGDLVRKENYPYIICLDFDFVSGHDALDLYIALYGAGCEFVGDMNFGEYYVGAPFHNLESALYYNHENMKLNVSGVLLRRQNSISYFHNYSPTNRLNELNRQWLSAFAYTEE